MTELETIQRAKMYMDKLANGINPIDDTKLAEDDTINNIRLSKCFAFVSGILQRVMDNGGVPQPTQQALAKKPFILSDSRKREYAFSDEVIAISEIARRLNALIDTDSMQKITYQQIQAWLTSCGVLSQTITINGGRAKHPTDVGKSIGITVERRQGADGDYQVVLYNRNAQQFILDNLESIAPMRVVVETPEMRGKAWTKEQEQQLIEMHNNGVPINRIAYTLQRTSTGVRSRLKKLGLTTDTAEAQRLR